MDMIRTPRNRKPPDKFGSWQKTPRPAAGRHSRNQSSLNMVRDTPIGELLLDFADSQPLSPPGLSVPRSAQVQVPPFVLADEDFPPLTSPSSVTTPEVDENNNSDADPPLFSREFANKNSFSRGTLVFAKVSNCPFWPGKIMGLNKDKFQVFLFGFNKMAEVYQKNICILNDETRAKYGKSRRCDSQWYQTFQLAMSDLDTNPSLPDQVYKNLLPPPASANGDTASQMSTTPSSLEDCFTNETILQRIPLASRHQAGKSFVGVMTDMVQRNDTEAFGQLLRWPSCLGKPKRAGRKSSSLATIVNRQIKEWKSNPVTQQPLRKKPQDIKKLVTHKIESFDIRGAVRILSSRETVLPYSEEVKNKLAEKHPHPHHSTSMPPPPESSSPSFLVTKEEVKEAIRSFKNGSAGGPDGLCPQHLKDMTSEANAGVATEVLNCLVDFINNLVLPGILPEDVRRVFYGANLMALSKKDNGVRPIAVGLTLRRLVGKVVMARLKGHCNTLLHPHQTGVGLPRGAEIATHALRQFMEKPHEEVKVLLKIDFRNAFNTVRRDKFLEKVSEEIPQLYKMVWQSYSQPSNLYYNEDIIPSMEGVQQGDPLGPFLFCLGIQDLINRCKSQYKCWFMDDGTMGDSPEVVLEDFIKILDAANSLGLEVNTEKCEIMLLQGHTISDSRAQEILAPFIQRAPDIQILKEEDLTLLGAPITEASIDGVLREKLEALKLMSSRLEDISSHEALFLLRHCVAIPKLQYFLRSAPCFKNPQMLEEYDLVLQDCVQKIINVRLDEEKCLQSSLPVKFGGLGVRRATDLALPAFLASAHGVQAGVKALLGDLVSDVPYLALEEAEETWKARISNSDLVPTNKWSQKEWDEILYGHIYKGLLDAQTVPSEKARLLAIASEEASNWLNAIPVKSCDLKMDDDSLRIAVGLRLGASICIPYNCICGQIVDPQARHGLSCPKVKGTFPRHYKVNELIHRALGTAGMPSHLEERGLCESDDKRPDGMTLFAWSEGLPIAWDYTNRDTVCQSYVGKTSKEAGKAAEVAEKAKLNHYNELSADFKVIPVATETFGSWGSMGLKWMRQIGDRIAARTGDKKATFRLLQRISMAIMKGNVASVKGTARSKKQLDDYFFQ